MQIYSSLYKKIVFLTLGTFFSLSALPQALPEKMQAIMQQPKYEHGIWGVYVKDLHTNEIIFDLNSNKLFSPASTSKLFSITALLHAFGDDYRFKTPVYATQPIKEGKLQGNLILVAQGDLTMGGRQQNKDQISFTKLDHTIANEIPHALLTPEDPLLAFKELAKQVYDQGLRVLSGEVLIDDRLFDTTEKRGMTLSPMIINENLIDIVIDSTEKGEKAKISWRPEIAGYTVENQVITEDESKELALEITADPTGHHLIIKGHIPNQQKNVVRTFAIKNPKAFAQAAFKQALQNQGIKINPAPENSVQAELPQSYKDLQQIALWTSPPLSEYAKLILKVSHNMGADLVPLLLASQQGKKTFDEGMRLLGNFITYEVKLSPDTFVFVDAAGGNENRLTPQAEIQLLEVMFKKSPEKFKNFYNALPVMGVDGSLADFGLKTAVVGKARAKTGTGVAYNLATGQFFLITQALAGYIEAKNGHLLAYMLVINNGKLDEINDIFAIFEDQAQLTNEIYNSY